VTGHALARVDSAAAHTSVCECGWHSAEALTLASAEGRWRIHARRARAATVYLRAEEVRKAAVERSAETAALQARARVRVEALQSRRGASQPARPRPVRDAGLLESARQLAGISTEDLWVRYVRLGGTLPAETLSEILAGTRTVDGYEHDLIAVALNELFADAGFGNPIDYWGSS